MKLALALLLGSACLAQAAPPVVVRNPLQFDRRAPKTLARQARAFVARGRYLQALPLLERRLQLIEEKEGGAAPQELAGALSDLADVSALIGRYDQAEALYDRAWITLRPAMGLEDPAVLRLADQMAELYRLQGRWLRAEEMLLKVVEARERRLGTSHPQLADSLVHYGRLLRDLGRYVDSESVLQRALALRVKASGRRGAPAVLALRDLASLYRAQGRLDESADFYKQALVDAPKALGPRHPETAAMMGELAEVLKLTGEPTEAARLRLASQDIAAGLQSDVPAYD